MKLEAEHSLFTNCVKKLEAAGQDQGTEPMVIEEPSNSDKEGHAGRQG